MMLLLPATPSTTALPAVLPIYHRPGHVVVVMSIACDGGFVQLVIFALRGGGLSCPVAWNINLVQIWIMDRRGNE